MAISKIENNSLASGVPSTAKLPAGTILQVVQTSLVGTVSTASNSAVATGLTASITPTAATSKILCIVQLSVPYIQWATGTAQAGFALYRNGSNIGQSSAKPFFWEGYTTGANNGVLQTGGGAFTYLDSPATTSSTTYAVYFYFAQGGGTTNSIFINSDGQTSYIQLLEVAA